MLDINSRVVVVKDNIGGWPETEGGFVGTEGIVIEYKENQRRQYLVQIDVGCEGVCGQDESFWFEEDELELIV